MPVAPIHHLEIPRRFGRRWPHPSDHAVTPLPQYDNDPRGGWCPACDSLASTAPGSSEYRGDGIIHHEWQCGGCNHEWVTVVHMPV
jgi:hypothetical protein